MTLANWKGFQELLFFSSIIPGRGWPQLEWPRVPRPTVCTLGWSWAELLLNLELIDVENPFLNKIRPFWSLTWSSPSWTTSLTSSTRSSTSNLDTWNTWILDCLKESTAPRSCSFLTAAWTWTWAWWAVFSFSARAAPTASLRRGWLSCCIVSGFQQWLLLFSNLPWLALIGWGWLRLAPFFNFAFSVHYSPSILGPILRTWKWWNSSQRDK